MVTEAQREQILDLADTMSLRQIAETTGVSKSTVAYIIKSRGGAHTPKKGGRPKKVQEDGGQRAPAPAPDLTPAVSKVSKVSKSNRPTVQKLDGVVLSPTMVATVALDHLISEIDLYHEALAEKNTADVQMRQTAEWKVINHEKLIQGHLKIISSWFGMDKGDVLKAIEEVRADPLAGMTKEELIALYCATEGSA